MKQLGTIDLAAWAIAVLLAAAPAVAAEKHPGGNHHTIVVGTELDCPPYSYLDENGEPTGFNVELTRAIAEVMGLDVEIRIDAWGKIRESLETGKIDAVSGMYLPFRGSGSQFLRISFPAGRSGALRLIT